MNVSVIIPAYNAANTIADTLESLIAQTYSNWEAIVVDDGSTDATSEITLGFIGRDARIRMIQQPNGGESAARNSGIALARYEWLLFLDADDLILPSHLEHLTNELLSNPELDSVICGSARVALDGTLVIENYMPPVNDMFSTLARRATFPIHACIVRKSLIETVGKFDTSLKTGADWDFWQRIARKGARFGVVNEVLSLYRMRPNSVTSNAYQLFKDGLRLLKQGHSPDPRVTAPHPDYANGSSPEGVNSQVFYLLTWCAGLLLGRGEDARPLLETIKEHKFPELYPDAIAKIIFESTILPKCRATHTWEELWSSIKQHLDDFLIALEAQSLTPDLARRAHIELKKLILKHSPTWQSAIEKYEQTIAILEEQRRSWQGLAEEREFKIMKLQEKFWVRLGLRLERALKQLILKSEKS